MYIMVLTLEIVCNFCFSDVFYPEHYIPRICRSLLNTLAAVRNRLKQGQDTSLKFLSVLLGKLCISGYSRMFAMVPST